MKEKHLYFAYGSNLNRDQMQKRCPQARPVTVAHYPNHALSFTKQSVSDKWGKGSWLADMSFFPGYTVWGIVYKLSEADLTRLDKSEGVRIEGGYLRQEIVVYSEEGERIIAWSYFVKEKAGIGFPSEKYLKAIVDGAHYHSLPRDYIKFLESIQTF